VKKATDRSRNCGEGRIDGEKWNYANMEYGESKKGERERERSGSGNRAFEQRCFGATVVCNS
jgi:hypothetical protein